MCTYQYMSYVQFFRKMCTNAYLCTVLLEGVQKYMHVQYTQNTCSDKYVCLVKLEDLYQYIFINIVHGLHKLCTDIYYCTGTVQFRLSEEEVFSVEELLGMIFSHGKKQAEDFTEQKIKVGFLFF